MQSMMMRGAGVVLLVAMTWDTNASALRDAASATSTRDWQGRVGEARDSILVITARGEDSKPGEHPIQQRYAWMGAAADSVDVITLRNRDGEPVVHSYSGAAVLSNGRIVLEERYEDRVVLFDTTGRMLASAGRKGAGPGEFESIAYLVRLRADSIGVGDATLRRISIFDPQLRFVRTEPVQSPSGLRGFASVIGQFADGRFVTLVKPISTPGPDGTRAATVILSVSGAGAERRLELSAGQVLRFTTGTNRWTETRVPFTSTRGVAVCERGVVFVADDEVTVYDTSLRVVMRPPFRGFADTLSGSRREEAFLVAPMGTPEQTAKYREALSRATPRTPVRFVLPIVSADGMLWYKLRGQREGRHVRTTMSGVVIDTVFAPLHAMHAYQRLSVASGVHAPDEEAPGSIVRQRYRGKSRSVVPPSLLGRCNAIVSL